LLPVILHIAPIMWFAAPSMFCATGGVICGDEHSSSISCVNVHGQLRHDGVQ
jgi:hypothetical protein